MTSSPLKKTALPRRYGPSLSAWLLFVAGFAVLSAVRALNAIASQLARSAIKRGRPDNLRTEAIEALRELDASKRAFASLASHELRTPLASIVGNLELLEDDCAGPLTDQQRCMVAVARRQSAHLVELVGNLLTVSQIEAGTLQLKIEPVAIAEVIYEATAAVVRFSLEAPRIEIDLDPRVGLIAGDHGQLRCVVAHLIDNARKFTPRGGVVRVTARPVSESVRIEVSDGGIGIPAADQRRLLSPFFRATNAENLAVPGAGLGLAIAEAVVRHLGGTITIDSVEAVGTTVTVDLPGHVARADAA